MATDLANILSKLFVQRGTKGQVFQLINRSSELGSSLAAAISQQLKGSARVENCILFVDSRDLMQNGQSDAFLWEISRCVMSCRLSRTRPLIVWLNPSPKSTSSSASASKQVDFTLTQRLHKFCSEANVILIEMKAHHNLPDGDRNNSAGGAADNRETLAELESISNQIVDLFAAESAAISFRK